MPRAGITEVILPDENEKDLEEIPAEVRERMEFHLVESMDEVLRLALDGTIVAIAAKTEAPGAPTEPPPEPGPLATIESDGLARFIERSVPAARRVQSRLDIRRRAAPQLSFGRRGRDPPHPGPDRRSSSKP